MNEIDNILLTMEDKKMAYVIRKMIDNFLICPLEKIEFHLGEIKGALFLAFYVGQLTEDDSINLFVQMTEIAGKRIKHRI